MATVAAILAALTVGLPIVREVFKAIKPASTAAAILAEFPGIERKLGKRLAFRVVRVLIRLGKARGRGAMGGQETITASLQKTAEGVIKDIEKAGSGTGGSLNRRKVKSVAGSLNRRKVKSVAGSNGFKGKILTGGGGQSGGGSIKGKILN